MNDPVIKELAQKWNSRHDLAKINYKIQAKSLTKEQLLDIFQNQMTCDEDGCFVGKLGFGPKNFNEYSVSAFGQEFKAKFSDKVLIGFGTNTVELKVSAGLCASSMADKNTFFVEEVIPQPLMSFIIHNNESFDYGLYLKNISKDECAIICYDKKGRKMQKSVIQHIDYLKSTTGVKSGHRSNIDNHKLNAKEREQLYENYATIISNFVYQKDLMKNSGLRFVQTSINGSVHKVFEKSIKLSTFLDFDYFDEQKSANKTAVHVFEKNKIQYLSKVIPFAKSKNASIIIGHNSDGSQLIVAERVNTDEYKEFSDEELGALLCWWSLSVNKFKNDYEMNVKKIKQNISKSIVLNCSNNLLNRMSTHEGFEVINYSKPFQVIDNIVDKKWDNSKNKLLFCYGNNGLNMCEPEVLADWDGIGSAVHISQLAVYLKAVNKTSLRQHLTHLFNNY